jgi:two-component system response regulator (stage 0 sporulation protein A)
VKNLSEKIKLVVIDDNPVLNDSLCGFFSRKDDIEVAGTAQNAMEAAEMIKILKPDAIIMDIIMPHADGLSLLERLNTSEFENPPSVIILSAIGHEALIKKACGLGAKYFMVKPFDYEILYKRLLDMFNMHPADIQRMPPHAAPTVKSKSMDEKITTIFLTIGIPAHIKGYQFLREAVKMVVKNPDVINRITKELYPGIAFSFDTSSSKVERAIRHAIEVAWTRGKIENINTIFGYNIYSKNDKPTNGEFIALVADKLLMDICS